LSDKRGFLTKMGKGTGDHQPGSGFAVPNFPIQPANPAFSWTELTLFKNFLKELDPLIQFSFPMKTDVRGDKDHVNIILTKNRCHS
jgi:hypothetical protein